MNNSSITISENTIEKFLKLQLSNIRFKNEEKTIYNNNGIKIITNTHIKKIDFSDFDLISPNMFYIKNLYVEFEKINAIISVDIKQFKNKKVIVTPDIPDIKDPLTGKVIIEGADVPDIVLWSVDLFGENPDITLTVGLEEFIKPIISSSFTLIVSDYKVLLELNEFEINDFMIPDNIVDQIKNNVIEEVYRQIKESVGNEHIGKIISGVKDLFKLLPIPDFTGVIVDNLIKNKEFENIIANQIKPELKNYVLYVPNNFKLGSDESQIELNINTPIVTIENNQILINIDINEL